MPSSLVVEEDYVQGNDSGEKLGNTVADGPPPPHAIKLGLPVALLQALPLTGGVGMGVGVLPLSLADAQSSLHESKKGQEMDVVQPPSPMVLLSPSGDELKADDLPVKPIENATLGIANAVDIVESLFKPHRITFTLNIPIKRDGFGMGLGLRELPVRGALLVHTLKRSNECPVGLGEMHGFCLGDVVLGIGYEPVGHGGLSWLAQKLKSENGGVLSFQLSRDLSIMPVLPPTKTNQSISRLVHHASTLHRSQLITLADRFRLHELALQLLAFADNHLSTTAVMRRIPSWHSESSLEKDQAPSSTLRGRSEDSIKTVVLGDPTSDEEDLDSSYFSKLGPAPVNLEDPRSLVVWSKGLRPALSVRVLYARPFGKTVLYILWVEDVASGKCWKISKRFSECRKLQAELVSLIPGLSEIFFPRRRLAMKAVISHCEAVETRIVHLEAFLRRALWICMGSVLECPAFADALRLLEGFLGVPSHVKPFHQNAPSASKLVELHVFKLLESPGASEVGYLGQTLRTSFDAVALSRSGRAFLEADYMAGDEGFMSPAFRAPLEEMGARLKRLEQVICQLHSRELWIECQRRKREIEELRSQKDTGGALESAESRMHSNDAMRVLMHRAIRRQVEAFLFLPLRRSIYRCMYRHLSDAATSLEEIINELRESCPADMFLVPEGIQDCHHWEPALRAFRRVAKLQLPCDQIAALSEASKYVVLLHQELFKNKTEKNDDDPESERLIQVVESKEQLEHLGCSSFEVDQRKQLADSTGASMERFESHQFLVRESSCLDLSEESEVDEDEEQDGDDLVMSMERKQSTKQILKAQGDINCATVDAEEGVELFGMYNNALLPYSTFSMEGLTPKNESSGGPNRFTEEIKGEIGEITQEQNTMKHDEDSESLEKSGGGKINKENKVEVEQWLSADDFLPIFTYSMVHASPPHLLLLLEYLKQLMDPEESIKERGYYVATLEASVHLILEIHRQLRKQRRNTES